MGWKRGGCCVRNGGEGLWTGMIEDMRYRYLIPTILYFIRLCKTTMRPNLPSQLAADPTQQLRQSLRPLVVPSTTPSPTPLSLSLSSHKHLWHRHIPPRAPAAHSLLSFTGKSTSQ